MADIVILLLIAAYCVFVVVRMYRNKKSGSCSGCCSSSSCKGCNECSAQYFEKIIEKAKEGKS